MKKWPVFKGTTVQYFTITVHLSIWPDKSDGLLWEWPVLRGTTAQHFTITVHLSIWSVLRGTIEQYFTITLHLKSGLIKGMAFGWSGLITEVACL
jgi:hypothetical protein